MCVSSEEHKAASVSLTDSRDFSFKVRWIFFLFFFQYVFFSLEIFFLIVW